MAIWRLPITWYEAAAQISFPGARYRMDIAKEAAVV
jgi:phosphoribosylamine-glycine ligase